MSTHMDPQNVMGKLAALDRRVAALEASAATRTRTGVGVHIGTTAKGEPRSREFATCEEAQAYCDETNYLYGGTLTPEAP